VSYLFSGFASAWVAASAALLTESANTLTSASISRQSWSRKCVGDGGLKDTSSDGERLVLDVVKPRWSCNKYENPHVD